MPLNLWNEFRIFQFSSKLGQIEDKNVSEEIYLKKNPIREELSLDVHSKRILAADALMPLAFRGPAHLFPVAASSLT